VFSKTVFVMGLLEDINVISISQRANIYINNSVRSKVNVYPLLKYFLHISF
jgi:hypothetical protein